MVKEPLRRKSKENYSKLVCYFYAAAADDDDDDDVKESAL